MKVTTFFGDLPYVTVINYLWNSRQLLQVSKVLSFPFINIGKTRHASRRPCFSINQNNLNNFGSESPPRGCSHFCYVGLGSESTVYPQEISGILKKHLKVYQTQNSIPILYLVPKKRPLKRIEMAPKIIYNCGDPKKKYPQNLHNPKNIHFSGKPPKY